MSKPIISFDFGTTSTSAAYWIPGDTKVYGIQVASNRHTELTILAWHNSKRRYMFGCELDREVRFGLIPPEDVITLPKLSLDRSAQTVPLRRRQKEQCDRMPQPASSIGIVARFLRWFKKLVLEVVENNLGRTRYLELAVATEAVWVLTLPANWEEASDDLRQAAREAGLGEIQLVTETEAAAAAMLESSSRSMAQEPIVVLDVGGGTHNVNTYIVKPDGTMEEGLGGTGGLCGSHRLNQDLQERLTNQWRDRMNNLLVDLGKDPRKSANFHKLLDECNREFENEKQRFDGFSADEDRTRMVIPIRGIPNSLERPDSGSIVLTKSVCEAMFAKITVLIMEAVKQQIRDFNAKHFPIILKRILFFGGLSKSPHVQKSLRRYFLDDEIMGYPVDVVLPLRTSPRWLSPEAL